MTKMKANSCNYIFRRLDVETDKGVEKNKVFLSLQESRSCGSMMSKGKQKWPGVLCSAQMSNHGNSSKINKPRQIALEKRTWRRANAAQARRTGVGFRSMAINLPTSAPLEEVNECIRTIFSKYNNIMTKYSNKMHEINMNRL
jgi:hypothetical protein